ncbi:amidohydrolase family protein [Shewanella aestuarii]|uniref:Amidohydrolase family protein n=1 Tax=Shewanella aestuarii TaxID=1028752 RepID=A0A6G9QGT5_9GAMM|nr:amidohydrolase family protein [Shewanella aestuarii]QIR13099.1 amidohydrolase family protein [Shewanella aestuarii]
MKLKTKSLVALTVTACLGCLPSFAMADSFAITNAKVYTATELGVLDNAVVVVTDGMITSVTSSENAAALTFDNVIDAQGGVVTPGFIASMNALGLVEVSAVADSRDSHHKNADITFDPSYAYNPKASSIAYTRKGGITRNVVTGAGGEDMFAGQAFLVDLSGEWDSVKQSNIAVYVKLGANSEGSRAAYVQELVTKLEKAQKAQAKSTDAKDKSDAAEPELADEIINELLAGKKPLVVAVDRAIDILTMLKIKQQFGLNMVLIGGADAVLVADEIAKANVPVMIDAMRNLPDNFDSLHNHLANAGKLTAAGVKVILTDMGDSHNVYGLRYSAGNAVANGMSYQAAIEAITSNVADTFKIDTGRIAPGKTADLVIWSGDPFEYSSQVVKMFIDGKEQQTKSRHDKLRDRYMTQSDMPRAYSK